MVRQVKHFSRLTKGAIALFLLSLAVSACSGEQLESASPGAQENISVREVDTKTQALIGQTATVRSEIEEIISADVFTISDEQLFDDQEILIIADPLTIPPLAFAQAEGIEVQVTGEVRSFNRAEIERELGRKLASAEYETEEKRPTIIAKTVLLSPDPSSITENPQPYYGKTLAVTGVVKKTVGTNAFILEEDEVVGAGSILAVTIDNQAAIKQGAVAVTGELRPFVVPQLEQEYELDWASLQKELEANYKNVPVLIADAIAPIAAPE